MLMAFGCYDNHDDDDQQNGQTDGGDDTADGQSDDTDGIRSDRRNDNSDGENSNDNDTEDILELTPEEFAEIAADAVCSYYEACRPQSVSCEISGSGFSDSSGFAPQEIIDVHCEVRTFDMGFDDCREEIGVGVAVQKGLECADITPQQARDIEACLSALNDGECVEITDEMLREYEAAIARGEDSGIGGMPDVCIGLEDIFECAESGGDVEGDALSCEPGQRAACTCANGEKGTQTCLSDRTYSPCVCSQGITPVPVSGVAGMSGGAAGGAVPISRICVEGEALPCFCTDGSSAGVAVCIDGSSISDCQCAEEEPAF